MSKNKEIPFAFTKTVHKNNAKISLDENGKICIVAAKKIPAGAEMFCDYGKGYWRNMIDKAEHK